MLLSRAIRSVLAQTMQRFEMVVVLDGEDAATAGVVERFADERITLVALEESVGWRGGAERWGVCMRAGSMLRCWMMTMSGCQASCRHRWMPLRVMRERTSLSSRAMYIGLRGQPDEVWPAQLPKGR